MARGCAWGVSFAGVDSESCFGSLSCVFLVGGKFSTRRVPSRFH